MQDNTLINVSYWIALAIIRAAILRVSNAFTDFQPASITRWSTPDHEPFLKGELQPKISLLHMKVITLIKAKSNVFLWYVQCCSCTRRSKTKILTTGRRHLGLSLTLWRHNVKLKVLLTVWCYLNRLLETLERFFWLLQEINKRRNMEINNHKSYSRCRVWRCDVTMSNSIQDGGALVVNIWVFDLRVQLQHCTYQRKTLLFALIKVSTFICKREILGCSSPLTISGIVPGRSKD